MGMLRNLLPLLAAPATGGASLAMTPAALGSEVATQAAQGALQGAMPGINPLANKGVFGNLSQQQLGLGLKLMDQLQPQAQQMPQMQQIRPTRLWRGY